MRLFRYLLISDGSSDVALMPILDWLLQQWLPGQAVEGTWVDYRDYRNPPRTLKQKVELTIDLYGTNYHMLCIHRDAENQPLAVRAGEIQQAVQTIDFPVLGVIPIRMQEAWLLIDEDAIRLAAANPNGTMPLSLPAITKLEALPDPKLLLHELLREATGLNAKRKRSFNERDAARRVAEYIQDMGPLRRLSAFQALETNLQRLIVQQGWINP